ncbi:hypothetical protein COU61_01885 [Candidatus Pacearchaeota archaeon CG10_big_fil_rev_8_21_14_0_10_35_13]|nr:MAG: hypothetical protein COU61_01885 [Candidatus Pacearchaeota archaeon CG10_big_fil_rev_8_21_14_0_10_35_13]
MRERQYKEMERAYEEAVKNPDPKFRQEFLDRIDLGPARKYLSSVKYKEESLTERITIMLGSQPVLQMIPNPLSITF